MRRSTRQADCGHICLASAFCALVVAGCSSRPMDLSVMNLSDEELEIASIDAAEFGYSPPLGTMNPRGQARSRSGDVLNAAPKSIAVAVRGKPATTVSVPPLPDEIAGRRELQVVYTRSARWVARWEITPERTHDAPLHWDTTDTSPLASAARFDHNEVLERLLLLENSAFAPADIERALVVAADPDDDSTRTLRTLLARFGSTIDDAVRVRMLERAAKSNRRRDNGAAAAGPAIYELIDGAKFDVNTKMRSDGHTLFDIVMTPQPPWRDEALVSFLRSRGARSGMVKK